MQRRHRYQHNHRGTRVVQHWHSSRNFDRFSLCFKVSLRGLEHHKFSALSFNIWIFHLVLTVSGANLQSLTALCYS